MPWNHPCTNNRRRLRRLFAFGIGLAVLGFSDSPAGASIATNTFTATITVQASCLVVSTNTLNFGTQSTLAANTDASATFDVQCTNTTPYNVGLNAGTTAGGHGYRARIDLAEAKRLAENQRRAISGSSVQS